jgi:uncharacterized protein DUF6788
MQTLMSIEELEQRIEEIKNELVAIGEMRPGSLSEQYNVCGNPTCRCKDPKNPQRHGPYYQLSARAQGQTHDAVHSTPIPTASSDRNCQLQTLPKNE